jgi:O-antigen/teichoic acid export membrane protein
MDLAKRLVRFLGRTDGSLQRRAFRSSIWVALSSVGVAALTFARGVVLARLLSPEVFGLMAISLMATRLIDIFTETGFGAALIHRSERFEDARDTAFTMMVARGFGLAALCALIAPWVARAYDRPALTTIVAVSGASFILMGLQNINMVALQKELNLKILTYMELAKAVLAFTVSVALAYWLRSVWALVFAQVAGAAITSVLSFLMVPGRVRLRFDPAVARDLYRYGRFITGLAIVVFLTRELDNALIGKLLGMESLGYYVVAYSLATIPVDFLSRFLAKVFFPMFSKLQKDVDGLRTEYLRAIRLITVLMVPLCATVVVLAPEIVQTLYGGRWSQTVGPLRVLALFGLFRALWLLNGYLYNAIGKPYIDFYTNLTRLVVMGSLLFPLTRWYGLVGASIAVAAPMAAQFGLGLFLSRRFIGVPIAATFRPLGAALAHGAVLAVVLIAAKSVISANPLTGLIILTSLGGAVCLALNLRDIRTLLAAAGAR